MEDTNVVPNAVPNAVPQEVVLDWTEGIPSDIAQEEEPQVTFAYHLPWDICPESDFVYSFTELVNQDASYELRDEAHAEIAYDGSGMFIAITAAAKDAEFWKGYAAGAWDFLRKRIRTCRRCRRVADGNPPITKEEYQRITELGQRIGELEQKFGITGPEQPTENPTAVDEANVTAIS